MAKEEAFVIDSADPFKNDALNRKECAESLKRCVSGLKRSEVICIDAAWGEGKTTFLQMWAQMLRNEKFPVIWFNAWENDFSDDPFVCLLGEVGSAIDSVAEENKSKAQAYLDQAKKCATMIARRSIPVAAKLLTAGLVETDKIVEQTLAGLAEQIAKEQIEKYEKAKQTLKGFRESLENFAQQVSAGTDKPLIFIIDELDRCRPSFAIGLLEKAKHLFNVDGIVLVLAADKRQLGSSIKSVYGSEIDVNGYLRRFNRLSSPDFLGLSRLSCWSVC